MSNSVQSKSVHTDYLHWQRLNLLITTNELYIISYERQWCTSFSITECMWMCQTFVTCCLLTEWSVLFSSLLWRCEILLKVLVSCSCHSSIYNHNPLQLKGQLTKEWKFFHYSLTLTLWLSLFRGEIRSFDEWILVAFLFLWSFS